MNAAKKTQFFKNNQRMAAQLAHSSPWNVTDPAELGPCITTFVNQHESYFRRWAESWFMTMMYVFSQHNFKWSARHGFAVDFDDLRRRTPSNFLRAYTNIARIAIESLVAGLYSNMPVWDAETIDESAIAGRRQRKIISKLLGGTYNAIQADKDLGAAAFVFAMFGQMAFDSSWNPMAGKIIEIPRYVKQQMPTFTSYMAPNAATQGLIETPTVVTDVGGRPYLENDWIIQRDDMGREIIDKVFAGSPELNVLTPFEYRRMIGSIGTHKTRAVQIFRLVDFDKWLDRYGQLDGKTRFYEQVQPVYGNQNVYEFAFRFFMRMMYVAPPSMDDIGGSNYGYGGAMALRNKVLVVEHYDEPHPLKWPQGRRVIISNGQCTHITKPQYNTGKMDGWHPLSEAQWMNCYPSSIASGPMQDVARKNHELNVLDSFMATAARRNFAAPLLIKVGSGIDPDRLVGEPGTAHEVADPYGARFLHDEIPIPPVLTAMREILKQDTYDQSGALDAQRGGQTGAKSGYQDKIIEEREEKRLAPARKAFRSAVAGSGEKILYALKANVIRLDDSMVGYMIANAEGEFTPQDVISFMSKPLGVGTQVKVVEDSMSLRSKASYKALLQEIAQGPASQRLAQDAKVLDRYLKEMGVETLRDRSATHRERAERENETFLDMIRLGFDMEGIAKPLVLFEDDDAIHIEEHTDFIAKYWDTVRHNKAFLMEFYIHLETHRLQQQEKQATLMPGTSLETGAMVQQASLIPRPSLQTIGMDSQMRKMQQAQQAQQPGQGAPPASEPKQPGQPGAKPQSPSAPSQTQRAARPNAPQGAQAGAQP